MAEGRKRSFTEFSEEEPLLQTGGVAETVNRLKNEADEEKGSEQNEEFQPAMSKSKKRRLKLQKRKSRGAQSADTTEAATNDQQTQTLENDLADGAGKQVVVLKEKNNKPGLQFAPHKLNSTIRLSNMQELLLYCLADGVAPGWISVRNHGQIRRAVVLFVPGLEQAMFTGGLKLEASASAVDDDSALNGRAGIEEAYDPKADDSDSKQRNPDYYLPKALVSDDLPEALKPLADVFPDLWPAKAPGDDKYSKVHSPLHAILTSSIPKRAEEKKNGTGPKPPRIGQDFKPEPTPVTSFLLTIDEMLENEYIVHPVHMYGSKEEQSYWADRVTAQTTHENGWTDTAVDTLKEGQVADEESLIKAGKLTAGRTVFALDCEMCMVGEDDYALTRISIVGWDGEVVLDELVKPDKPITDYVTRFSGMTKEKLDPVSTSLGDIQRKLLDLLSPDTILVGHSLDSDLRALKLTHPFIIDTAILYPHPRGPPLKSSLKWLAQKYLSREIQKGDGATGHDSIEDARACLDLVRQKCEKGPQWGTSEASTESIFKRLSRTPQKGGVVSGGGSREGKTGAIVDVGGAKPGFRSMAPFSIVCSTDAEIPASVRRCVLGNGDGAYIPGSGVDFTWARFRSLEKLRGWANDNRSAAKPEPGAEMQPEPTPAELGAAVSAIARHVKEIREFLPPCTLLMLYSGTGDPRELARLQEMQRTFKREYSVKKWDQLTVKWTDVEEQALKRACRRARAGIGMMTVT